jgi:hypothetical protein
MASDIQNILEEINSCSPSDLSSCISKLLENLRSSVKDEKLVQTTIKYLEIMGWNENAGSFATMPDKTLLCNMLAVNLIC